MATASPFLWAPTPSAVGLGPPLDVVAAGNDVVRRALAPCSENVFIIMTARHESVRNLRVVVIHGERGVGVNIP